ncbi:LysM peptidoglycan-binding domain-containing protein [Pseudomonas aeruginosa]|uniref:LysM peptidoglycan-binding domain-containing protein n=1 Tax=Pseudomonas aeruginosa TaxID=287 RepID=UPI003885383B
MTKANECTCPSGDGSLRHPCPAHPASVELAGVGAKLTFINGRPAMCGCQVEYSSGGGEYSDVIDVTLCAKHSGSAILDLVATNRIALTPEYEGQWHADFYLDREIPLAKAEGATPAEAVLALMSAERIDPEQESVEQAGGDERVIGWRERILAAHPNSDPGFWPDALLVEHMAAEIADLRAALAQPSPVSEPLIYACKSLAQITSSDGSGHADIALAILRMAGVCDDERERLVNEWKAARAWKPSPAQAEQAEAERPELWAVHAQGPDELYAAFTREDAEKHAAELNALPMPEGIAVGAVVVPSPWPEAEHWKYLAEQERDHKNEIAVRLRQFERICEGLPQDAIDGGWTVQGIRAHSKQLEEQLKVALARVAELTATRNRYGVDAHYFNKNLQRILRDFESFTPDELARSLIILAKVADEKVVAQAQHSVPAYVSYTTRPAESLAGIALRQLKDESRWVEIRDINAHAFPDMQSHSYYPAGTVIKLPAAAPGKEVGHE